MPEPKLQANIDKLYMSRDMDEEIWPKFADSISDNNHITPTKETSIK
jgi:hypothetical protein